MIPYEKKDGAQPSGAMLVGLTRALRVTANQLLGPRPAKEKTSPHAARLLKRIQKVEALPLTDQRVVLKFVDGLLRITQANGRF